MRFTSQRSQLTWVQLAVLCLYGDSTRVEGMIDGIVRVRYVSWWLRPFVGPTSNIPGRRRRPTRRPTRRLTRLWSTFQFSTSPIWERCDVSPESALSLPNPSVIWNCFLFALLRSLSL